MATLFTLMSRRLGSARWLVVAAAFVLGAWGVARAQADIVIADPWSLHTETWNGFSSGPKAALNLPFDIPLDDYQWVDDEAVSEDPGQTSISITNYYFAPTGQDFLFDFGFDHQLGTVSGAFAKSMTSIKFTPTGDGTYDWSGGVSLEGGPTGSEYGFALTVEFLEEGVTLFNNHQESSGVDEESFTLGELGGDPNLAELIGSLSGALASGNEYELRYTYLTTAQSNEAFGAFAAGGIQLDIWTIPAPGAALLGIIGLSLIGWRARRSRVDP